MLIFAQNYFSIMFRRLFILGAAVAAVSGVSAREPQVSIAELVGEVAVEETYPDSLAGLPHDSVAAISGPLSETLFLPALYMPYRTDIKPIVISVATVSKPSSPSLRWIKDAESALALSDLIRQTHAINHPGDVHLNLYSLPEPPKAFILTADPETATFVFSEVTPTVSVEDIEIAPADFKKQHWLNKFNINLQFSQAFISPNWYQGGNSSLNLIADFSYQSNLNTKFHPNLLFENFFQWRTALQTVRDDPHRKYALTENRFQINSKFGYKAAHNWYYTITGVLKTPIFNGYKSGTQTRTASFFSPGELNIGAGMTYNLSVRDGKFTLGVTLSPISYNLKTCIDSKIDETSFGIKQGRKAFHSYGSAVEVTWNWTICYNVNYSSRIFAFTNCKYFQGDWQNQFQFTINRFLTANLNVDLRYDTSASSNPYWHKLQLRELFSLGFTHYFSH